MSTSAQRRAAFTTESDEDGDGDPGDGDPGDGDGEPGDGEPGDGDGEPGGGDGDVDETGVYTLGGDLEQVVAMDPVLAGLFGVTHGVVVRGTRRLLRNHRMSYPPPSRNKYKAPYRRLRSR